MVLKLVPPAEPPEETPRRRIARTLAEKTPSYLLKCPRCAGMELVETVTGVQIMRDGKRKGGTKVRLCLSCLMRGERIEVL